MYSVSDFSHHVPQEDLSSPPSVACNFRRYTAYPHNHLVGDRANGVTAVLVDDSNTPPQLASRQVTFFSFGSAHSFINTLTCIAPQQYRYTKPNWIICCHSYLHLSFCLAVTTPRIFCGFGPDQRLGKIVCDVWAQFNLILLNTVANTLGQYSIAF
jgi:hypothetical protein